MKAGIKWVHRSIKESSCRYDNGQFAWFVRYGWSNRTDLCHCLAMSAREKIIAAFNELVLSRRYDDISSQLIIARAEVARSTFYAHFRSKDDLLVRAIEPMIGVFADVILSKPNQTELESVLAHIWEQRSLGQRFFHNSFRQHIANALFAQVGLTDVKTSLRVHGLLGLLHDWVSGRVSISAHGMSACLLEWR